MAQIVVFGVGQLADLAHVYLTHDSPHQVVAFTLDRDYLKEPSHRGLPVLPFDEIVRHHPPSDFDMFIPMSFKKMNHVRADRYRQAKEMGYRLVSYVSSKATTWPGFTPGDNCFILEGATIQPFVEIGSDCVIWNGAQICHHTVVKDHVFIASQAVVNGACTIEEHCFLGANATVRDETLVARETLVGAGTIILEDTQPFEVYKAEGAKPAGFRSDQIRSLSHKSGG